VAKIFFLGKKNVLDICPILATSYPYATPHKILRCTILIFSGHEIPKSAIDTAVREFYGDPWKAITYNPKTLFVKCVTVVC
jgi:hypothetical protein